MSKYEKNIVLTGATRGMGLSHAIYLAEKGYNIALVDISDQAFNVYDEVASIKSLISKLSENGTKHKFFPCDLTDFSRTEVLIKEILDDYDSIYGVVLNAGGDSIGNDSRASGGKPRKNNIDISIKDHDAIFNRNYITCFNSIKAIIPYFKEAKHGKIVTTSSVSANTGVETETAYSIAKTAIIQLTRSVAVELRPFQINVNCIAPSGTTTGRFLSTISERGKADREKILSDHESVLMKPAEPELISSVVSFLLSPESSYISGQVIRIDGGQFTTPI